MAAWPSTRADVDNALLQIARSSFRVVGNIHSFKAWLDGYTVTDMGTNWSFDTTDANNVKSAFTDLDDWAKIFDFQTSAYLTGTHDYRVFAKRLLIAGQY